MEKIQLDMSYTSVQYLVKNGKTVYPKLSFLVYKLISEVISVALLVVKWSRSIWGTEIAAWDSSLNLSWKSSSLKKKLFNAKNSNSNPVINILAQFFWVRFDKIINGIVPVDIIHVRYRSVCNFQIQLQVFILLYKNLPSLLTNRYLTCSIVILTRIKDNHVQICISRCCFWKFYCPGYESSWGVNCECGHRIWREAINVQVSKLDSLNAVPEGILVNSVWICGCNLDHLRVSLGIDSNTCHNEEFDLHWKSLLEIRARPYSK